MATSEQIAANQANAQKSTGPKTEAGKAASSQNSWKHGLTFGVFRVLDTESQMQYQDLLQELIDEHKPATPPEAMLVERMAQHHWLRNRALNYQTQFLQSEDGLNITGLSLFMRYETMHERAFHKCLADLLKLRAETQKQEIGFAQHAHKQELRRLDLLCRGADVNYHEARATGAQLQLEYKEHYKATQDARHQQQADNQKAA